MMTSVDHSTPDSDTFPPAPRISPRALFVMRGPFLGRLVEIPEDGLTIGRAEDCGLIVGTARDGTSRRHARVFTHQGMTRIEDLGSTNGMLLNGHVCRKGRLFAGDRLEIGRTLIKAIADEDEINFHKKLYEMTIRDPLTGLYNRSYLDEALRRELTSGGHRRRMSVILFDLDNFKRVNDSYGHPAGNTVLKEMASLVGSMVPQGSSCFRYGGDEFLMLMPGIGIERAVVLAERFRRQIAGHRFRHENSVIPVSISIGVSEVSRKNARAETLILAADEALYQAKNSGRNKVVHAPGDDNSTRRISPLPYFE